MRSSLLSTVVAATALSNSVLAVKGVIKDQITTDEQGCRSLCGLNNDCFAVLYDSDCHECWQLDCHPDTQPPGGLKATGKSTDLPAPKCDGVKFPTKPTECKKDSGSGSVTTSVTTRVTTRDTVSTGAAATGTTASTGTSSSSGATPSETSAADKKNGAWREGASWLSVVGVGTVALLALL